MQLIGFNLKKILAERSLNFKRGPINTNIEFLNVEKEDVDLLKDVEALKFSFIFSITYSEPDKKDENLAEVTFEGTIVLSAEKEEVAEMIKAWNEKAIPDKYRFPLINFILKRCSTKALVLEEDINIPAHMPFPQVQAKNPDQ